LIRSSLFSVTTETTTSTHDEVAELRFLMFVDLFFQDSSVSPDALKIGNPVVSGKSLRNSDRRVALAARHFIEVHLRV
jgi:hypothetical protein